MKIGIVIDIKMSNDISYHGSSHYEEIYTVIDEEGNTFEGTYGHDYIHFGYGFKTYILNEDDQKEAWKNKITQLEREVSERKFKIQELQSLIRTKNILFQKGE